MNTESKTPMTDEQWAKWACDLIELDDFRDFAREIETKLAEAIEKGRIVSGLYDESNNQLAEANARIAELTDALKESLDNRAKGLIIELKQQKQIADLERDKARLDWIDENIGLLAFNQMFQPLKAFDPAKFIDLRQAIDAAMGNPNP